MSGPCRYLRRISATGPSKQLLIMGSAQGARLETRTGWMEAIVAEPGNHGLSVHPLANYGR
jgi:hypothetical protein